MGAMRRRQLAALVGLLGILAGRVGGAEVFAETFADNRNHWRLDAQWALKDGLLQCVGLAGQVLAVGCDGPEVGDFRARLRAERVAGGQGNYGYGLIYRFSPASQCGYFVAVGASAGYGFGTVEEGRFTLVQQGNSAVIKSDAAAPLELEVREGVHTLRVGEALVDVWRDSRWRRGGFGLVVIEAATVAFRELRLEALGDAPPGPRRLGPQPTVSATGALPNTRLDAPRTLGARDIEAAAEWRRHWNQMARAGVVPALPATLDAVDLAVLALLKDYHVTTVAAPATVLSGWLGLSRFADLGAVGSAPRAAVEFWLAYAAAPREAEDLGGQEDLLAGLSWYQAVRGRATSAAGAATGPLVCDDALQARLDTDAKRFEERVPAAERSQRYDRWAQLGDQVLAAAERLRQRP